MSQFDGAGVESQEDYLGRGARIMRDPAPYGSRNPFKEEEAVSVTPLTLDLVEKIAESMKTLHHLLRVQDQIIAYRKRMGDLANCQIESIQSFAIDMSFVLQSVVKDIGVERDKLAKLGVTL